MSRSIRSSSAFSRAVCPSICACVISGISKTARLPSSPKGKLSSGSAMPFKVPYCSSAAVRPPEAARYTARQAGTSIFSAVCSALESALPPSTGHRMSHSRRDTSLGGHGAVLPKQRAASRR